MTGGLGLCPECGGPRIPGHPGGFVWHHALTCTIHAAEDATQAADAGWLWSCFQRPATAAERTLLAACGVTIADEAGQPLDLPTTVRRLTASIRHRSWPGVILDEPGGEAA